jgi:hypothetical protein
MKIKLYSYLILILALSSCAIYDGSISSSDLNSDYVYEDIAFGVSQTDYFFSIGGLDKDALVLEAKRQLYRSRPLKENESYANFSVDFKTTYLFIYSQIKVSVSADVVIKNDNNNKQRFSDNYLKKLNQQALHQDLFEVGDSIIDKQLNKGVILDVLKNEKFRVLFSSFDNHYKSKKVSSSNIFSTVKAYKGLKVGDNFKSELKQGEVLGLGINGFLYLHGGNYYFSKYDKVEVTDN